MKTEKEWIESFRNDHSYTNPACICERCKEGRETFLLPSDIKAIQLDAAKWGVEQALEILESKVWRPEYRAAQNDIGGSIRYMKDSLTIDILP